MQGLTRDHEKRRCVQRRERKQEEYVGSFRQSVLDFLVFAPAHAATVTLHATPVGSGTVTRTERIPIHERAEAAVIESDGPKSVACKCECPLPSCQARS